MKIDLRATIDVLADKFHQMYLRCHSDEEYCTKRSKDAMGSPHRMDDIMEVSKSPKSSVDITEIFSGASEGRSTTPRGYRGHRKKTRTPVLSED